MIDSGRSKPSKVKIRSGISTNQGDNFSDSESDWDTSVDIDPTGQSSSREQEEEPQPKSRHNINRKFEQQAPPGMKRPQLNDRGDEVGEAQSKPGVSNAANANKMLAPNDRVSHGLHSSSPVPPYTSGFQEIIIDEDDKDVSSTYAVPDKTRKGSIYMPTPAQRVIHKPNADVELWEDSDAEQRTLQELHTNLRKEKTREMESEAARLQTQARENNMRTPVAPRSISLFERWAHNQEDKQRQKEELGPQRKKSISSPPENWSPGINESALTRALNTPPQPLFVSDAGSKRQIYFLNKGHVEYYDVDEEETDAVMPKVSERVERYIRRIWQEVFSVLRILASFIVVFTTELIHFGTSFVLRPLLVGIIASFGNQLIKPVLASVFSMIIQPIFIFIWNIMSAIKHLLMPVIDILGSITSRLAVLFGALRLVEVNLAGTSRGQNPDKEYLQRRDGGEVV